MRLGTGVGTGGAQSNLPAALHFATIHVQSNPNDLHLGGSAKQIASILSAVFVA